MKELNYGVGAPPTVRGTARTIPRGHSNVIALFSEERRDYRGPYPKDVGDRASNPGRRASRQYGRAGGEGLGRGPLMSWLTGLIWQPSKDARLTRVEEEITTLKDDMEKLKEQTRALESFHALAKDAE